MFLFYLLLFFFSFNERYWERWYFKLMAEIMFFDGLFYVFSPSWHTIKSIILELNKLKTSIIIIYEKILLKIKYGTRFLLFYHKVENQVSYKPHLTDVSTNLAFKEACFLNLKAAKSISHLWEVIGGAEEKNLTPSLQRCGACMKKVCRSPRRLKRKMRLKDWNKDIKNGRFWHMTK